MGLASAAALVLGEVTLRICGFETLRFDAEWRENYKHLHRPAGGEARVPYEFIPLAETSFSYRGPPVRYRINEDNLRSDRRYERPKHLGVKRVLMLGDSVLFGLGVEVADTFASRVEAALDGVEIINSGVGGYNTYVERLWFEQTGLSYSPDLVVLCYCPNDVDDPADHFDRHTLERMPPLPDGAIPNHDFHAKRIAAKDKARRNPRPSGPTLNSVATWAMKHSALANLCAEPFSYGRRSHSYERCLLTVAERASPESAWLERQLNSIAETAASANAAVVFVYVPLAYELNAGDARYERSRRNVHDLAVSAGFEVVNVFDDLERVSRPYLDVSHLSANGHRTVAEALTKAIHNMLNGGDQ